MMGGGPMRGVVEKPKNFNSTMTKLVGYCKKFLPVMAVALFAAMFGTVMQIIGPDKLKDLTNEVMKGLPAMIQGKPVVGAIDMTVVANIAWILVLLYGAALVLNYVQSLIMATVTQKISKKMRTDISQKVNRLPLKYFDSTSHGDVLSRVTNDVDAIGQTLNQSLGTIISAITMKYEDYKIFSNKICTDEKFKQYYVEDDRHNSILIGSSRAFFGNSTTTFFRPTQVFYPKNTCIKVKIFFVKVGKTSNYARQVLRFYKGVSLFFSEYLHENMKPIEKALVSLGKGVFGFAWRHGLNDRYLKFMKKHIWINESYNGERVTIARTKLFLEDWNRSTDIKYNHLNLKIPNHLLTWHFEGHETG